VETGCNITAASGEAVPRVHGFLKPAMVAALAKDDAQAAEAGDPLWGFLPMESAHRTTFVVQ
jgi:hypothetical protein